jgi:hypothetical protein
MVRLSVAGMAYEVNRQFGDLMPNTEEDIKQKVLMPFLTSLGFTADEMEFEKGFSIRLGKYWARVDTAKEIESGHPRLDVLVKRGGKNLFVVEAKNDESPLTEDDKEQAISYARLVHPMAPIAVVTNGRETKLYKVGTKIPIEKDRTRILDYSIDEDLSALYDDAFEHFVGCSPSNVRTFCREQVTDGMKTLVGSGSKRDRKFVPELYVQSRELSQDFNEFLQSGKPVFALVGESGSGKTCALCGLAREIIDTHPVLFYRALNLTDGPMKSIADDFNWTFSGAQHEVVLFKRLSKLFWDRAIIIFIDAVDEWILPSKVEALGNFVSHIKGKKIRLAISCKSMPWERFLTSYGAPTSLSEEVFVLAKDKATGQKRCCSVPLLDDNEFYEAVEKYRKFYNFTGRFDIDVLNECKKLPFLLRVFFEVAENRTEHLTFSVKEFYDRYFDAALNKVPHDQREAAVSILKEVSRILFDRNRDTIGLDTVRGEIGLRPGEAMPPALFDNNILQKSGTTLEPQVGFYFQKLRDYLIAFAVKCWHESTLAEFEEQCRRAALTGVQLDALSFYYDLATIEKKKVMDGSVRTKAEAYVGFYESVINGHFINFKDRFIPHTNGSVGFVGALDLGTQRLSAYSFRALNRGEAKVKFVPFEGSYWLHHGNRIELEGGLWEHYHGATGGFVDFNVKKVVLETEVFDQVKEIVNSGRLSEANNYYLALEIALGIVIRNYAAILGIQDKGRLLRHLPISMDAVEYAIRWQSAYSHFTDKFFRERAEVRYTHGSHTSMYYNWKREDFEVIRKQAHEAASNNLQLQPEARDINYERSVTVLREALATIRKESDAISETILPDEDDLGTTGHLVDFFTHKTLEDLCARICSLYLEEYKCLVETNFPTLKYYFEMYSRMPIRYFMTVGEKNDSHQPPVVLYRCSGRYSDQNEVILCRSDEIVFDHDREMLLSYRGGQFAVDQVQWRTHMLSPYYGFSTIDMDRRFTILRSLVYKQIQDELPEVFDVILQQYGVEPTPGT